MNETTTTRRGFLALSTSIASLLAGCGSAPTQQSPGETSSTASSGGTSTVEETTALGSVREAVSDSTNGGHAITVSGETKSFSAIDVTKTGDDDGDEADFYGTNAAVYAENGATLTLDDISVNCNGQHANAVFSYGEGTTINISNSVIDTVSNCSGGIMVTGGGTLNATDLTVHTTGNSSAPIRSDRGGGTQVVKGGDFTSDGKGSPVIYSTADVQVEGATLTSNSSQGVVVEGKNSVSLKDCTLVASNTSKNSDKSDWYQAVMIYQSMSGDAAQGAASFSAEGGSIANQNGDVFFVNNTVCTIDLQNVEITNADTAGNFLRAAAAGWGNEGSNGGQVAINATKQTIVGNMLVDEVSNLNLHLADGSTFAGAINPDGTAASVYVEVPVGCTWELAADSHITSLTCSADAIALNGFALYVAGTAYQAGTASTGQPIEVQVQESNGGPGGGEPPAKPGEGGQGGPGGQNGEPPAGEPPAKPDGSKSGSSDQSNSQSSDAA